MLELMSTIRDQSRQRLLGMTRMRRGWVAGSAGWLRFYFFAGMDVLQGIADSFIRQHKMGQPVHDGIVFAGMREWPEVQGLCEISPLFCKFGILMLASA